MKNGDLPTVFMKQVNETDFRPAKDKEIMADNYIFPTAGLTKREYFAAMAMQGILSNPESPCLTPARIAKAAVRVADKLLSQLKKQDDEKQG